MKKTTTQPLPLLLILLSLLACTTRDSDKLDPEHLVIPKTNLDQLAGDWEWSKTYIGWTGLETPASKGYTETLILGKDNTFQRHRNGVVTEDRYYYITKERSAEQPQDSILFLHLVTKNKTQRISSQPLYRIGSDTIKTRFAERCDDCPEFYFVRKKLVSTN